LLPALLEHAKALLQGLLGRFRRRRGVSSLFRPLHRIAVPGDALPERRDLLVGLGEGVAFVPQNLNNLAWASSSTQAKQSAVNPCRRSAPPHQPTPSADAHEITAPWHCRIVTPAMRTFEFLQDLSRLRSLSCSPSQLRM